jgi:hypothetical protein
MAKQETRDEERARARKEELAHQEVQRKAVEEYELAERERVAKAQADYAAAELGIHNIVVKEGKP